MLRGEYVMPLASIAQRMDGLKVLSVKESYEDFSARMKADGWKVKKFNCHDPVAVKNALHRWYNALLVELSKEHYPGRENEFWYRERV